MNGCLTRARVIPYASVAERFRSGLRVRPRRRNGAPGADAAAAGAEEEAGAAVEGEAVTRPQLAGDGAGQERGGAHGGVRRAGDSVVFAAEAVDPAAEGSQRGDRDGQQDAGSGDHRSRGTQADALSCGCGQRESRCWDVSLGFDISLDSAICSTGEVCD